MVDRQNLQVRHGSCLQASLWPKQLIAAQYDQLEQQLNAYIWQYWQEPRDCGPFQ
jgi:hypothetical protein